MVSMGVSTDHQKYPALRDHSQDQMLSSYFSLSSSVVNFFKIDRCYRHAISEVIVNLIFIWRVISRRWENSKYFYEDGLVLVWFKLVILVVILEVILVVILEALFGYNCAGLISSAPISFLAYVN